MLVNIHNDKHWIIIGASLFFLLLLDRLLPTKSYWISIIKLVMIALISLFVIMKATSYTLSALHDYGKQTGVSQFALGFVVLTIGTSLPDISNTIFASLIHKSGIVLGGALGANVLLVTLVLGISILLAKNMRIEHTGLYETFIFAILAVFLVFFMSYDGVISFIDGSLLLVFFSVYLIRHAYHELGHGSMKKDVSWKKIWKPMVVFIGTLFSLLLAARWFVVSSIILSEEIGIPEFLMGAIIIALGTTIPEITVGIHSAMKGMHHIGLGNSVGGIAINFGLVLAIGALISPITVDWYSLLNSLCIILLALISILYFLKNKELTLWHGIYLCCLYGIYVFLEFFITFGFS